MIMKSRPPSRRKAADPAVTVHLPENMLRSIDRQAHQSRITRSEVIRRLVEKGLANEPPPSPKERFQALKSPHVDLRHQAPQSARFPRNGL